MTIVAGCYQVQTKIGEGGFGQVFAAHHIMSGFPVAIKRELCISYEDPERYLPQLLPNEVNAYKLLAGVNGLPKVYYYGIEGNYNVLVMDRLGPSLKQLAMDYSSNGILPIKNVVYCAVSLIARLEAIHDRGLLFRDIKPDQVCIGNFSESTSSFNAFHHQQFYPSPPYYDSPLHEDTYHLITDQPLVYLVDFGLAKSYKTEDGKHIKNERIKRSNGKTGTARYASLNVHKGRKHSRRDDLESLAYCLIELVLGTLPWNNVRAKCSEQGWRKIGLIKEQISIQELCEGAPSVFADFLSYSRNLGFYERPDYNLVKSKFIQFFQKYWKNDYQLYW